MASSPRRSVDLGAPGRPPLIQPGVDTDDFPDRPLARIGTGPLSEPHPQRVAEVLLQGGVVDGMRKGLRPRSQIDVGCRRLTPWIGSANSCGRPQCLDSVRSSGWMCTPGRWSGMPWMSTPARCGSSDCLRIRPVFGAGWSRCRSR